MQDKYESRVYWRYGKWQDFIGPVNHNEFGWDYCREHIWVGSKFDKPVEEECCGCCIYCEPEDREREIAACNKQILELLRVIESLLPKPLTQWDTRVKLAPGA